MIIEITRVPLGPAPDSVKEQWVGVRMEAELMPTESPIGESVESDFTTGETRIARGGFIVRTETALNALAQKSQEAVAWFKSNIPAGTTWLSFGSNEAVVVQ